MEAKKVLISGIVAGFVLLMISFLIESIFAVNYSAIPQIWKPMTENWIYQLLILEIIKGIIYAAVFGVIYKVLPGKGWKKGLNYGFILWLVATIPGMGIIYISMAIPNNIIALWIIEGLVGLLAAGSLISILYNRI